MRKVPKYFLMIPMLLLTLSAYGQDSRIDSALDRYEIICDKCILLKEKTLKGEDISTDELKELLEQVSDLRTTLQKGSRNMSKLQKERFEIIRRRYTAAFSVQGAPTDGSVLKIARPVIDLPKLSLKQDMKAYVRMNDVGLTKPQCEMQRLEGNERSSGLSIGILVLGGWQPKSVSYGGRLNFTSEKLGFYLKGRTNLQSQAADYSCFSDGTSGGKMIWTSGVESYLEWSVGAGGIFKLAGPFSLYAGSGYGNSEVLWEDSAGKWALVEDYSAKGICADAGIIFTVSHFQASAGISTIAFKNPTFEVGLGIRF